MATARKSSAGDPPTYHKDVFLHDLKFYRGGGSRDTKFQDGLLEGIYSGCITIELDNVNDIFKITAFRKAKKFEQLIKNSGKNSTLAGLDPECIKKLPIKNKREFIDETKERLAEYEREAQSPQTRKKIAKLTGSLMELAKKISEKEQRRGILRIKKELEAHLFGSRKTGLAEENGDIDIFLDVGGTFHGSISGKKEEQEKLVKSFAKEMELESDFYVKHAVTSARVPILKFKHIPTKLYCDLSFKSGMSTMNSELVKFYLDLDPRVKFVVAGVKLWFKENGLAGKDAFTSYAQVWLTLFFLIHVRVVPSLLESRLLTNTTTKPVFIEDWNCTVPKVENLKRLWTSPCSATKEELLHRFFAFYCCCPVSKSLVLCPMTGEMLRRKELCKPGRLLALFSQCIEKEGGIEPFTEKIRAEFDGFCVQDPFDLMKNLTRNSSKKLNARLAVEFITKCMQTTRLF